MMESPRAWVKVQEPQQTSVSQNFSVHRPPGHAVEMQILTQWGESQGESGFSNHFPVRPHLLVWETHLEQWVPR